MHGTHLWWLIGAALAALLAVAVIILWRQRRVANAEFDAARTTAQLARIAPVTAQVTVVRQEDGIQRETRVGRAPLLARDGRLLHRGKRFYIGRPDDMGNGKASVLRGRGEAVSLDMRRSGTRYTLAALVVGRRRLSRRRRRQLDVAVDECFAVVPREPLVKKQDRGAVRYYLAGAPAEGEEPCTHMELDAHAYRVARRDGGEDNGEGEAAARLIPWRGSRQLKVPPNPRDAVRPVLADLERVATRASWCWLAQWTAGGALASRGRWRVAGDAGKGRQLQLSQMLEYPSEPLTEDGHLLLGYRARGRWKVLTANLDSTDDEACTVTPMSLPTAERGAAAEVQDFSLTGLRVALPREAGLFLLSLEEEAPDAPQEAAEAAERLAELEGAEIGFGLYPRFLFPPSATDVIPDLPGMAHLRVTVGRVEPPGDDPQEPVVLGLECAWEPTSYDPATALPAAWERLRGHRESAFMTALHRSLNQLSGQLEREGPMGVDG